MLLTFRTYLLFIIKPARFIVISENPKAVYRANLVSDKRLELIRYANAVSVKRALSCTFPGLWGRLQGFSLHKIISMCF